MPGGGPVGIAWWDIVHGLVKLAFKALLTIYLNMNNTVVFVYPSKCDRYVGSSPFM